MQVRVAIFDNRIFVDSPGKLPPGVTLENIEHVHVLRNPIIAQLLYDINYIENWGSGILRMKQVMQEYELLLSIFSEPGPNFVVTFNGAGDRFMREMEARPEWTKGLSERQIAAVLHTAEMGQITTGEYCRLVNVSNMTAYRDLRELCKRELLKQIGKKKVTYYSWRNDG
jgi:ATP-dependent DNA helicase RecG